MQLHDTPVKSSFQSFHTKTIMRYITAKNISLTVVKPPKEMTVVMQHWNIYRSHAVAVWLQSEGVPVIANVRWGDERTYDVCCCGVPRSATSNKKCNGLMNKRNEK